MRIDKAHRLHFNTVPKRLHAELSNKIIAHIMVLAISLVLLMLKSSLI